MDWATFNHIVRFLETLLVLLTLTEGILNLTDRVRNRKDR